jgi:hypothetical protein
LCSSAQAPRCGATCRSREADAPDFEREGAGLALGDHEADLADAGRVECRCAGDLSAAEGGAEGGQGNVQRLPGRARVKAGLVVDAVEGIVGQQVQLEALACGAGLDEAGLRSRACLGRRALTGSRRSRRCVRARRCPRRRRGRPGRASVGCLRCRPSRGRRSRATRQPRRGRLKSNSSHVVSGSVMVRFCGVGAAAVAGKMRLKKGDRDEPW